MSMAFVVVDLLAECEGQDIRLSAADAGGMAIDAPPGVLTPELLAQLKSHKGELLGILSGQLPPTGCIHSDPRCYLDAPDGCRPGWIRTTCCWCGRFIGYRRVPSYQAENERLC